MTRRDVARLAAVALVLAALPLLRPRQPAAVAVEPEAQPGRIVFMRNTRMAAIKPNGSGFEWLSGENLELVQLPHQPRLAPDGKRVAYGTRPIPNARNDAETFMKIHVRELDRPGPGTDLDVTGHLYCWSPDGTKLAVTHMGAAGAQHAGLCQLARARRSAGDQRVELQSG